MTGQGARRSWDQSPDGAWSPREEQPATIAEPSRRPSASQRMSQSTRTELERELATHLDTLRDLGPDYTDSVARAFMDQLDSLVEEKVRAELADSGGGRAKVIQEKKKLIAAILVISIPLFGIAGGTGGTVGIAFMAIAMFIIVIVAMTHNF